MEHNDAALLESESCACGRGLGCLERLTVGRVDDLAVCPGVGRAGQGELHRFSCGVQEHEEGHLENLSEQTFDDNQCSCGNCTCGGGGEGIIIQFPGNKENN